MPHLIIESTASLASSIVKDLHDLVGKQETVSLSSVKTRLYSPLLSFCGDESSQDHTAITLKLLPGRSQNLKEQIASNLFDKASQLIQKGTISVEIIDLGVYKK